MLWYFRNGTVQVPLSVGNIPGLLLVPLERVPVVPSVKAGQPKVLYGLEL